MTTKATNERGSFDGRPLRSTELTALIGKLEQYQEIEANFSNRFIVSVRTTVAETSGPLLDEHGSIAIQPLEVVINRTTLIMSQNGIAVPTTTEVDDREQLTTIIEAILQTAQNIVVHERDQQDGHTLGEEVDLSPLLDLEDGDTHTLAELAGILSSLEPEGRWQHEDWEPGDPCPECGAEHISVMEPREYFYTYDEQGGVVDSTYGDVSGPAMNHWCVECDTLLSRHPATALFWIA